MVVSIGWFQFVYIGNGCFTISIHFKLVVWGSILLLSCKSSLFSARFILCPFQSWGFQQWMRRLNHKKHTKIGSETRYKMKLIRDQLHIIQCRFTRSPPKTIQTWSTRSSGNHQLTQPYPALPRFNRVEVCLHLLQTLITKVPRRFDSWMRWWERVDAVWCIGKKRIIYIYIYSYERPPKPPTIRNSCTRTLVLDTIMKLSGTIGVTQKTMTFDTHVCQSFEFEDIHHAS